MYLSFNLKKKKEKKERKKKKERKEERKETDRPTDRQRSLLSEFISPFPRLGICFWPPKPNSEQRGIRKISSYGARI